MAVEYCHRGDHCVDLDRNVEGFYDENNEWVCEAHMTDEEMEE